MSAVCDASVFTKQASIAGGDPSAVFGTYSDYRLLHGANDSRSSHRLFHSVAVGIFDDEVGSYGWKGVGVDDDSGPIVVNHAGSLRHVSDDHTVV